MPDINQILAVVAILSSFVSTFAAVYVVAFLRGRGSIDGTYRDPDDT